MYDSPPCTTHLLLPFQQQLEASPSACLNASQWLKAWMWSKSAKPAAKTAALQCLQPTVFLWAVGPLAQLCNISIMLALLSTIWYYFSRCAWKDAVSWCNVLLELGNIQRTQQAKTACPMTLAQCVSGRSTGWLHPEFRVLLGFLSTKMQTWKTTFNVYTVEDYKQSAILLDASQLLVLAHPFEAMWCSSESGGSEAQRPVPRASSGFQVPLKQCTVMHFVTSWAIDYKWINYFEFQNSECLCFIEISDKRAACRACVQW